jgi:predicted AAA+ superfamily ATPase
MILLSLGTNKEIMVELDSLFERNARKLAQTDLNHIRYIMDEIDWKQRLIGLKGARGVGKTTLLLQRLKLLKLPANKALYVSCDTIWFSQHSIVELAETFVREGGLFLFLDEVHKYPNWAQELKNIYDDFPELHTIFTGSSLLEILNARADLSRRAIVYDMQGLSFREFLIFETEQSFPMITINDLLINHEERAIEICRKLRPLEHFRDYLQYGYYPFYRESINLYPSRVEEIISMVLYIELPLLRKLDVPYIPKIKQLLHIIAESAPFVPNVSKLSERIGINRNTFISYLYYLNEAGLTRNLYKDIKGVSRLQKPDKIYLDNPNLHYVLSSQKPNIGHVRECFFLNQLQYNHSVEYINDGDFCADGKFTFELGGKQKSAKQLKGASDAWIVSDSIEIGTGIRIPLWMFGFLY